MTSLQPTTVPPPSTDKRWLIVNAAMRRMGYAPRALIETLHVVQKSFGCLEPEAMRYVARSLHVPLSKVYGVATFYTHFRLKPEGLHTCVICLGTACYIKGSTAIQTAVERRCQARCGETTSDGKVSVLTARCVGACGIAPAVVLDGKVVGNLTPQSTCELVEKWLRE